MKKGTLLILITFLSLISYAQNDSIYKFNIQQAIDYALQNNLTIENNELEIRKAKWKVWETTAIGLPQVNGSIQYQNYPNIPTQLMPNFLLPVIIGVNSQYYGLTPIQALPDDSGKIPVQFGSEHNADWGISVSQIIFNGEYLVGLKAASTYKLISEQSLEKAQIELKTSVEQAYYLALIATQSLKILEQNYSNIKKLADDSQKMVDVGVTDQTQADQIKILELNLKNQISSLKRQEQLAFLMLKFQLGLVPEDSLYLTNTLDEITELIGTDILNTGFDIDQNIDYQMMNTQLQLKTLELRQAESKSLPTLTAFYSYSQNAMRDEFNFFDNEEEWFTTSLWGVKLQVPIFSSGQRASVIQQKKIGVIETKNQQYLLTQQLNIQFIQAKNDFLNAYDNFVNQKQNLKLSEKIYNDTQIKYKEGASSSMDLTQVQNQYLQAESSYYQALMQLLNAKTAIEKLVNQ